MTGPPGFDRQRAPPDRLGATANRQLVPCFAVSERKSAYNKLPILVRAAAQVLTCAEEFASVRSGLQALGIPIAEDRSGLIFAPLSTIEVPLNSLHALFDTPT